MTSALDPHALRATMRADLCVAMKARNSRAISALRTAIAAIDNAESVDSTAEIAPASAHIAGATIGLGTAEVPRRSLSPAQVHAILRAQIDERSAEADRYETLGQIEAAEGLRGEAQIIAAYL
ncbi:GatB/YqeY domain-containing protein [Mycobacteroides abscessus]|uniref:hypothetical protein n=1 Tax=Mycobacteroides abscessus TaxID=36809 RepID=UPI0005789E18|nr:hypothetical protein [Mycobacteroides abscessus]RIU00528.1 hypothetical protein D2F00_01995 [Mycobacteroides abscessus]